MSGVAPHEARDAAMGQLVAAARRWRRRRRAQALVRCAAVGLGAAAVVAGALRLAVAPGVVIALIAAGLVLVLAGWRRWRPAGLEAAAMARHLDRQRPELEESSELALVAEEDLPLVARLQRRRIEGEVSRAREELRPPSLASAWGALALAAAAGLLLLLAAGRLQEVERSAGPVAEPANPTAVPAPPPAVIAVAVQIVPPAYTGKSQRTVETLDLRAEEGAMVRWRIEVAGEPAGARLIFDESERLDLDEDGGAGEVAVYSGSVEARETRLYRVELTGADGSLVAGGYARLEVLPDRPPELTIVRPERFVELPSQRGQVVEVEVEGRDDYGLGRASLVATVASGFGELVEFRERRLDFDTIRRQSDGRRRYSARLDLDALGVVPGSEIFFFAEAADRRRPQPQSGRSATHIVRLPGDRSGSVGLASRLPILRVPEFFRSQRQIILDTERLLADEPAITAAEFRRRSESLGFDQRALRLRYGGLLGEEFESGRPAGLGEEEHEDEMGLAEMEPGGGGGREDVREALESLTQGLAHQHDSAEISTYFDSEIKAQLKAALEEMWGAEGRLRGVEPRRALPFEYRALTLLKQVQQRSRLYVQKIGFEAPVLYPQEKRLTGDLEDIRTRRRETSARGEEEVGDLRAAWAAASGGEAGAAAVLAGAREGARRLAEQARRDPELDLAGLESLRRWIVALENGEPVGDGVRERAAAALWNLLPAPETAPTQPPTPAGGLARDYLERLADEGSR